MFRLSLLAIAAAIAITAPLSADEYRWKEFPQHPGQVYLFEGAKQVGVYYVDTSSYLPYLGNGKWGSEARPPLLPPLNFGVLEDPREAPADSKYLLVKNGEERKVTQREAHQAVAGNLVDDSKKLRVTVIGADEVRTQISKQLAEHPDLADVVVQNYPPQHWHVSPGFVTTGNPTIYCQAPDGKVLHRQDDFAGGLDATIGALRKAKKQYEPAKDPDLRKEQITPVLPGVPQIKSFFLQLGSLLIAVAIGAAVMRTFRKDLARGFAH